MMQVNRLSTRALPAAICLTVLSLMLLLAGVANAGLEATKGRIPEAAFKAGGALDLSLVPDFVPALDRNGDVAGWISKDELQRPPTKDPSGHILPESPSPVFADDLKTVVGYMVPDKGFVKVGIDPAAVPNIPASVAPAVP